MKARAKKLTPPIRRLPPQHHCARCGRLPSHPHYGGGSVGGIYCNWFCARAMHLATGCGVFRIEGRDYIEVIAPWGRVDYATGASSPEEPPSPSMLCEQVRAAARPAAELLLASGMRPAGSKLPPKTTADCVEHIFGQGRSSDEEIIRRVTDPMYGAAKNLMENFNIKWAAKPNGAAKR